MPSCLAIRASAPARLAGSRRASTAIRVARSRSSSGYFLGAAMTLILTWIDSLHQTRGGTVAGRAGAFVGRTGCVPADHLPGPPAGQPHEVLLLPAGGQPGANVGVPEAMRMDVAHPGLGRLSFQHLPHPGVGDPRSSVGCWSAVQDPVPAYCLLVGRVGLEP